MALRPLDGHDRFEPVHTTVVARAVRAGRGPNFWPRWVPAGLKRGQVGVHLVEAAGHSCLRFGRAVHLWHVGLMDDSLRAAIAQVVERDRRDHATLDVGLGPGQPDWWFELDEFGTHGEFLPALVIDHRGLE